ncbi:hypothetical protein CICLE_v10033241mg [Citrus x clementina]|uniref:Uncharacterized protein n=1 Tax=Citrus clementina TaxID=85681 RepID=V4VFK6_CITCL|nr:hypothetical protein CICLE_v10033241mg [Citrus x clementina]
MLCLGQVSFSYKPYYALLFPSGRLEKLQMFGCFSNVNACRCLLPKKEKKKKKCMPLQLVRHMIHILIRSKIALLT